MCQVCALSFDRSVVLMCLVATGAVLSSWILSFIVFVYNSFLHCNTIQRIHNSILLIKCAPQIIRTNIKA